MPDDYECVICNSKNGIERSQLSGGFSVWQCNVCELQSSFPPPTVEMLQAAYQNFNAGEFSRNNFTDLTELATHILQADLSRVEVADPAGLRFLDYGSGGGHFLKAAQEIGMTAVGLEVDEKGIDFAKSKGLEVRILNLAAPTTSLESGEKFDVIFLNHVLEHVGDPRSLLEDLSSWLAPGGIFSIRVPDQNSIPAKIKVLLNRLGVRKVDYGFVQPPIHLHGFCMTSVKELARQIGFKIERLDQVSAVDQMEFPTTSEYWDQMPVQKAAYSIGTAFKSGGHLATVLSIPRD